MKDLLRQCLCFVLILTSIVAYRPIEIPGVEVSPHARVTHEHLLHDSYHRRGGGSPLSASLLSNVSDTMQTVGPTAYDTFGESPPIEVNPVWAPRESSQSVAGGGASVVGGAAMRDGLKAFSQDFDSDPPKGLAAKMHRLLMALGGGTGLFIDEMYTDTKLGRDFERRTAYQSSAVVLLLCILYYASISSGLSFLYWRLKNNSPVSYYADPRFHDLSMEGHDLNDFLSSFNVPPKNIYLQVVGLLPASGIPDEAVIDRQGEFYGIAFTFAFDLTPWLARTGRERGSNGVFVQAGGMQDGVLLTDIDRLKDYLTRNTNDLATVEVQKEVAWPGWEELATNIKQRIRQRGFTGVVSVHFIDKESVFVHKNRLWANFLHNQATKILIALTIFGFLAYVFYMWVRRTTLVVRAQHRIDITPDAYWRLIEHQLSDHGFSFTRTPLHLQSASTASDANSFALSTTASEGTDTSSEVHDAEGDGAAS